jgi:hypothetical protein
MFNQNFMIMKKLLIVLLSFIMIGAFAQNGKFNATQVGQKFKGFMVTEKHDTVRGTFEIYTQDFMQLSCSMMDPNGKELYGNSWNNILTYQIENDTKWYSTKFTTLKAPADPKRQGGAAETFLLCEEAGPITLFEYNFVDYKASPVKNEVKTFMQLPNGEVVDASSLLLGYAKKMSGYVKDDTELAAKITNKEKGYGMLNINSVVREYNTWYMSKNPGFTIFEGIQKSVSKLN